MFSHELVSKPVDDYLVEVITEIEQRRERGILPVMMKMELQQR